MADPRFEEGVPIIWALLDDRPGNVTQAQGVADALQRQTGFRYQIRDIRYNPAAALPNVIMGATFMGLTTDSVVNLCAPWPDVVIAAGRRTAPVARNIKELSKGKTFIVQLMNPGGETKDFDILAVPRHDGLAKADNIVEFTGAPHRVTAERLAEERDRWLPAFAELPEPRIALIVGGDTKRRKFTPDMAAELAAQANAMAAGAGGSLMVTTSRRTSAEAADALFGGIDVTHTAFRWGDDGENPYFGYLACADAVIVTGESVSMSTEACATEGPVYLFAPKKLLSFKHKKLNAELIDRGFARPLGGDFDAWRHEPLNAAEDVAAEIRRRFNI